MKQQPQEEIAGEVRAPIDPVCASLKFFITQPCLEYIWNILYTKLTKQLQSILSQSMFNLKQVTGHSLVYHGLHPPISELVGGLEQFFYIFRIIIPTDFHIFQEGWNHQPEKPPWVHGAEMPRHGSSTVTRSRDAHFCPGWCRDVCEHRLKMCGCQDAEPAIWYSVCVIFIWI